ncbi:hypothetical protein LTR95_002044 [Oleoguttula sp. CCFEE 5521]
MYLTSTGGFPQIPDEIAASSQSSVHTANERIPVDAFGKVQVTAATPATPIPANQRLSLIHANCIHQRLEPQQRTSGSPLLARKVMFHHHHQNGRVAYDSNAFHTRSLAMSVRPPNVEPQVVQAEGDNARDPESESEWEYEYDDNETEDVYFTLDLSTYCPGSIARTEYSTNGKRARLTAEESNAGGKLVDPKAVVEDVPSNDTPDEEPKVDELQILGLHTKTPSIKHNNDFYTCNWFTDLGTQFWISDPGVVENPRFAGHVLDVIGSSQVRLVGRPATLKRKRDAYPIELDDEAALEDEDAEVALSDGAVSDDETAVPRTLSPLRTTSKPISIDRRKIKDPHLQGQASFMERLSQLKHQRGERDAHLVPLRTPVYYKGAEDPDALRAEGMKRDAAEKAAKGKGIMYIPGAGTIDLPPGAAKARYVSRPGAARRADGETLDDEGEEAPRIGPRKKGNPGGAPSNEAKRRALGLEPVATGTAMAGKKRGRPSKKELEARALGQAPNPDLVAFPQASLLPPVTLDADADSTALVSPTISKRTSNRPAAPEVILNLAPTASPRPPSNNPLPVSRVRGKLGTIPGTPAYRLGAPPKPKGKPGRPPKAKPTLTEYIPPASTSANPAPSTASPAAEDSAVVDGLQAKKPKSRMALAREARDEAARKVFMTPGQLGMEVEFQLEGLASPPLDDGAGDVNE